MKTKKSSLSLILALVMVFVMASGALADTGVVEAGAGETVTSTDIIYAVDAVADRAAHGVWAHDGGRIDITANITTKGIVGIGIYAQSAGFVNAKGDIETSGHQGHGIAVESADVIFSGKVETLATRSDDVKVYAYPLVASGTSFVTLDNATLISHGRACIGLAASGGAKITGSANVATYGPSARGIDMSNGASVELVGSVVTEGDDSVALAAANGGAIDLTGDATTKGALSDVVYAKNGTVSVSGGEIRAEDPSSTHLKVVNDGTIILSEVTIDNENKNLLQTDSSGSVVAKDSTLVGDALHDGSSEGTLDINLTDSVWNGAAEAIDNVGVINVDLINSQWNVTGDTNTNGKITGDADSKVDFNGTDENITVIIDRLEGEAGISVKPGDKLIIKNPAGNVESSNPDVIEVITNDDGSVEIISKGDGEADLTYEYVDEDGKIKEVTVTVVSGAGSQPAASGGGGSSNCNTGVGAALFALFGLALIQKRK